MKTKNRRKKLSLNKTTILTLNNSQLNGVVGGTTGDCLSFIGITCPDPNCDFQSIPLNECFGDGGGGDVTPGFQEPNPTSDYAYTDCYPGDGLAPA